MPASDFSGKFYVLVLTWQALVLSGGGAPAAHDHYVALKSSAPAQTLQKPLWSKLTVDNVPWTVLWTRKGDGGLQLAAESQS